MTGTNRDTIAAVATPPGQGGIGIVRISGPYAKQVLEHLWRGAPKVRAFESHKLYYGAIVRQGTVIDRALVSWMRAPKSYTGEDTVEISGHGGAIVMERILEACCESGARAAGPGEFTKRAFLNGKMDLVQAEAVADTIAATSHVGLNLAQAQLAGRLSRTVNGLQTTVKELRAAVEASIDFPEEDVQFMNDAGIEGRLGRVIEDAAQLAATFYEGRLMRDGVRVAIAGRPNAGKSSLFNALAGHARALVHHEPGTTRDVVEETVTLEGISFVLRDTAGLRAAAHEVEAMGITRAHEEIAGADLVLYVVDAMTGITPEDKDLLRTLPEEKRIVVWNKADLIEEAEKQRSKDEEDFSQHLSVSASLPLGISTLTMTGFPELKRALVSFVRRGVCADGEGVIITNVRHKTALDDGIEALTHAATAVELKDSAEFVAHHLRHAQECLGRITGAVADDALLDEIFSRFCIGK